MWNEDRPSPNEPLTDSMISEAEALLGVQFPETYLNALRTKNGGCTVGTYIRLPKQDIPDHLLGYIDHGFVSIGGINGIGASDQSVLCTPYMVEEWQLPAGLVLLDGDGHTWIALDFRNARTDPPVVFLLSETGDTLLVANSFQEFFTSLVPIEEVFDYDGNFIGGATPGNEK